MNKKEILSIINNFIEDYIFTREDIIQFANFHDTILSEDEIVTCLTIEGKIKERIGMLLEEFEERFDELELNGDKQKMNQPEFFKNVDVTVELDDCGKVVRTLLTDGVEKGMIIATIEDDNLGIDLGFPVKNK